MSNSVLPKHLANSPQLLYLLLQIIVPDDPDWEREFLEWRAQLDAKYSKTYPPQYGEAKKLTSRDDAE